MRSPSSGGWSRPVRWPLWLTAGAALDVFGLAPVLGRAQEGV